MDFQLSHCTSNHCMSEYSISGHYYWLNYFILMNNWCGYVFGVAQVLLIHCSISALCFSLGWQLTAWYQKGHLYLHVSAHFKHEISLQDILLHVIHVCHILLKPE